MVYSKRVRPPASVPAPPLSAMILTEKLATLSPGHQQIAEEVIDSLLCLQRFQEFLDLFLAQVQAREEAAKE